MLHPRLIRPQATTNAHKITIADNQQHEHIPTKHTHTHTHTHKHAHHHHQQQQQQPVRRALSGVHVAPPRNSAPAMLPAFWAAATRSGVSPVCIPPRVSDPHAQQQPRNDHANHSTRCPPWITPHHPMEPQTRGAALHACARMHACARAVDGGRGGARTVGDTDPAGTPSASRRPTAPPSPARTALNRSGASGCIAVSSPETTTPHSSSNASSAASFSGAPFWRAMSALSRRVGVSRANGGGGCHCPRQAAPHGTRLWRQRRA